MRLQLFHAYHLGGVYSDQVEKENYTITRKIGKTSQFSKELRLIREQIGRQLKS
jgi:hypothetical protein